MKTKKEFDAVSFMRQARKRLEETWRDKPQSEELEHFATKYGARKTRQPLRRAQTASSRGKRSA